MASQTLGVYDSSPAFKDVVPIPQDDGPYPLAQIAYSDHYAEAMSYLRALMVGQGEMSERALLLTGDIIAMNPAHYTIWAYRARILFALNDDLADELDFIDVIAEENPKNYQIFHHRQKIVAEMSKRGTANFERELDFTEQLIDADQKNYHVWSYRYTLLPFRVWTDERQWLVKHFELSHSLEVAFTKRLIESDILNNSAWSHRYYTLFGNGATGEEKGEELVDSEVEFAKKIIRRLSSNAAPWNYLRGVLKKAKRPLSTIETFALEFAPGNPEDRLVQATEGIQIDDLPEAELDAAEVPTVSVHAMDVLAEIYAEKNPKQAKQLLQELAVKYDTLRKGYWQFRMEKLGQVAA